MTMQFQIISINALIISLLIDLRRGANQKSFNVKFHSIQSFHNIITTVRTSNLSEINNSLYKHSLVNSFDLDDLDSAVLLQSKKCTNFEIQEKLQCFEDLPQDRYEVLHNSSVVIKCVVRNQHGKVQWRAQNVVLGYDRSVPGMERLNIIGDASKGEHNLQISNIQPEDSGEYECQVQPVTKHSLLRKKAQVTVHVLPSVPVIYFRQKKLTDHTLIITPMNKNNYVVNPKLVLECFTNGLVTPLQFIWYWNRQVVSETNQPEVSITSLSNNGSQIELRIDQLKSNDKIQCRVENKASRMIRKRMKSYIELSVTITILFYSFPGEPKILNLSVLNSKVFEDKETLNMVCRVSPVGSPIPEIRIYWNFNPISLKLFQNFKLDSSNGNSVEIKSQRITIDSFKDELSGNIVDLRLSKWHHAANLTCFIKQLLLKNNYFSTVRIYVKYPPSVVKIYQSSDPISTDHFSYDEYISFFESIKTNASISLIDGQFYRFACSTNLHYTTLNINWSLAMKENSREQYNLDNIAQSEIIVGLYFKQTNSFVELKATKEINNMDLLCTAWPVDSVILSASIRIKIYYSPNKPTLSGYTIAEAINEHETISLLCSTKNGYPLPDLVWYKENATLSNAEPVVSNGDKISSLLSFKVSREDNGKIIKCAARNIATGNFGISSNSIAIRTIFPARYVKIKSTPFQLKQILENTVIYLSCETDSSNPASDIQWWVIRCSFLDGPRLVKRLIPCSKVKLKELHREIVSGEYSGWRTISKLKYSVKWLDNENFVECESKLPNSDKATSSLHYDRLRLNVIFGPHFSKQYPNGSVFQAEENLNLTIKFNVFGNPKINRFVWLRGHRVLESNSNFRLFQNTLRIFNLTRYHRGNYSMVAHNDIGKTEILFFIDVKYAPVIVGERNSIIHVPFKHNISVGCEVASNPYSTANFQWKLSFPSDILAPFNNSLEWHINYTEKCPEFRDLSTIFSNSTKPFASVSCATPRKFATLSNFHSTNSVDFQNIRLQCFYHNNISSSAIKNFIFYIHSAPEFQAVSQFAFEVVESSEAVTFTCIFKGYPINSVEWHNCTFVESNYMESIKSRPVTNNSLTNQTLLLQSTDIQQIRPNFYRAEQIFSYRDLKMLNRICCQAANRYGTDHGIVRIVLKSKPNPPENVQCLQITSNFLLIKWDQGFNGGSDQSFRIKVSRQEGFHEVMQFDISGNRHRNSLFHNISGLLSNVCFVIRVGSFNNLFADVSFADPVIACTLSDQNISINHRVEANTKTNITNIISINPKPNEESIQKSTSFIVTVAGCVFGFIILIINMLTFVICYKKKQERIRKRRQSKEVQSTDERQTENLSKYDSSLIENHLYDGSILAASDSCFGGELRDKEEEIPMLMYQKPICPLHFVPNDQYSNPLIIQDHYLQSAISCNQTINRNETTCYGCTSIELPLNSMILSNQYLPFPLLESTYSSLMRNSCEYSLSSTSNPSDIRILNETSQVDSRALPDDTLSNGFPKIPLNISAISIPSTNSSVKQKQDSYQNIFQKYSLPEEKQPIQSPTFQRGFVKNSGNN
uniref:NPHS1-4 n=1 Tax=Schmidtea mediterranea TaxID=79327 RepID=A0A0H3YFF3_SCHMD|nr:NPHS1-4 [Schmidtea mediterranea]